MTVRRHASGVPQHPAGRWVIGIGLSVLLTTALVVGAWRSPAMRSGQAAAPSPSPSAPVAVAAAHQGTDPVTVFELADPVVAYQGQIATGLARLEGQVGAMLDRLRAGDLSGARSDWLAAHLTYHRLGAAYGAFGDAGTAIDGLAAGRPGGTGDPDFTGFHKVEQLLWAPGASAQAAAAAVAPATWLLADVKALHAKAATLDIRPNEFTVRAHEILEDTLQVQLTGADDYGSGSGLATAVADLEGTRAVVQLLRPVIERRQPGLPARIDAALNGVDAALSAVLRSGGGRWTPVRDLPRPARQRVDAAVSQAVEVLAPVPGLLAVEEDDDD